MRATRTYLELTSPGQFKSDFGQFPKLVLERVARPTPALYRDCYRTVGAAYHWRDRWDWTDDDIRTHLANPEITLHVATRQGALAGWYELRRVAEDDSEIGRASCRERGGIRVGGGQLERRVSTARDIVR